MAGQVFRKVKLSRKRYGRAQRSHTSKSLAACRVSVPERPSVRIRPGHLRSRESDDGRLDVSGLIMLAHHPGPDVRGAIAKDNTTAGFVLAQEVNGVTIRED